MPRDIYHITFYIPGLPFDGDSLETQSLGGSETAAICLGREMVALGHDVRLFCNTREIREYDGVIYCPLGMWSNYALTTPHDIEIVQRDVSSLVPRNAARINILWCHDLASGRSATQFRSTMWNIDKVFVLSKFMKDQYKKTYGLPNEALFVTRNGLDLGKFKSLDFSCRDRKLLVYSARPERGLDILLDKIFPKLLEADPDFRLHLFGYDNPIPELKDFYASLAQQARQFGDRVSFMGNLPKSQLYEHYAKSGIYVYPTPSPRMEKFAEISCLSVAESMACGMPVVSSHRGALPETLAKRAGYLVKGDPQSDEYVSEFCSAVLRYADNENGIYDKASRAGIRASKKLSWTAVAKQWNRFFDFYMDKMNNDRVRLAYHFYRRSDIIAARAALQGQKAKSAVELSCRIDREYAFADNNESLVEHYAKGGISVDDRLSKHDIKDHDFNETREQRFKIIEELLTRRQGVNTILEFGCGHGWSTIYLHNKVGKKWTGIDLDEGAIKWARKFADHHAATPEDLEFILGNEDIDLSGRGKFDCLLVSEVLEHCIDPVAVMNKLERWIKPGGYVVVTVPYGPAEYGTSNWKNFRNHLWEFDHHDLREMFGHRKEVVISSQLVMTNELTDEPVGYYLIEYEVDGRSVKPYDMERKLRLQRPRQTLGGTLIAGPDAEDMLRWCLKDLYTICDEIVIVDTGLNEEALAIAKSFDCKIIKGSNPLESGFETPRNEGLKGCSMDWVLWIDTDEKLLNPHWLGKYLRHNIFDGYSIRQHHFCVDSNIEVDLPVRVFRRSYTNNGKTISWVGKIHEHVEVAVNKGPGLVMLLPEVHIAHVGYLAENIRRRKFARNDFLVQKDMEKYPERLLQKHFVMRDLIIKNIYEMGLNNGKVTDGCKERAREVKKLYRKYFLGKKEFVTNIDTWQYYSAALEQLGEGLSISFDMKLNREGVGEELGPGSRGRFVDYDEAIKEIGHRLKGKFDAFEHDWW